MVLRIDKSVLLVLILEASLWGFSLMMFGMTMYLICRGRSLHDVNHWNVARSCLLLLGSTIHLCASSNRVVHGLILDADRPGGPIAYFRLLHRESIYQCTTYCFQTLLGDAIVIHRCYVVWQTLWVVLLPILIWFGTFGFSINIIYRLVLKLDRESEPLASSLGLFMTPVFSLTLAANLISTGLLAFRIYKMNRELSRLKLGFIKSVIYPVMRTAIDAGVLYTLLLTAAIINQTGSTDPFELPSIIVPSISIIFYMFIMRISISRPYRIRRPESILTDTFRSRSPPSENHRVQLTTLDFILSETKTVAGPLRPVVVDELVDESKTEEGGVTATTGTGTCG